MARFLLIHGASHGAWCWRDVIPRLAALGHEAQALDLPNLSKLFENDQLGIRAFVFNDPEGYQIEVQSALRDGA